MKIAFDAIRIFNNRSGLGNYSRYVIKALADFGSEHKYQLFTPRIQVNSDFAQAWPHVDLQLPGPRWRNVLSRNYWRTFKLGHIAAGQGAQVFHGLTHELPANIDRAGIRSVVTMHDVIYLRLPELFSPIDRKVYDLKFRRSCRLADRVIAISQQTKRDLVELYGIEDEKIEVIYQGCHPVFRERAEPEQLADLRQRYGLPKDFLLQVGSIEPRKNLEQILGALRQVSQLGVFFVIAGRKTKYQAKLEHRIQEFNMGDQVKIINDVPLQDLPLFYQAAYASVYASLFEGFGLPVLESITSGTPVISSSGTCLEEAGGAGGVYVNPLDTEALANAISRVFTDQKYYRQLKEQGVAHAQFFRADSMASRLLKLYESLV